MKAGNYCIFPRSRLAAADVRLLRPDMTKGRHARTVFVSAKLRAELQAYADQAKCVERSYLIKIKNLHSCLKSVSIHDRVACKML